MPPSANPSEPGRKHEEYDEGVAGAAMSLVTPLIEILFHLHEATILLLCNQQAYPNPFDAPVSSVILTFLLTLIKHPLALREDLAAFLTTIPKKYGPSKQGAIPSSTNTAERGKWITNGCTPPYRKTWCLRGMEWESRRVFERGYWKSDSITSELDVLAKGDHFETTDGKIEDNDGVYGEQIPADGQHHQSRHKSVQGNLFKWRELDQAAKQEEEEKMNESEEVKTLKTVPDGNRPPLCVVPDYTILVIDTNILLSSLSLFGSIIDSLKWTIVLPLSFRSSMAWHPTPLAKRHRPQLHIFSRISIHMASPSE
ncbi:hypothetical protein JOM56_014375 [Amanita muscaria]